MIKQKGMYIILSSPSGAGKTSLAKKIIKKNKNFELSISYTTRQKRQKEIDKKDYYFISKKMFDFLKKRNFFIEYAKVFNNYYGTSLEKTKKVNNSGKDILFDIDWQGSRKIKKKLGDKVTSIFILPPSKKELIRRLNKRAQDPKNVVKERLSSFKKELSEQLWSKGDKTGIKQFQKHNFQLMVGMKPMNIRKLEDRVIATIELITPTSWSLPTTISWKTKQGNMALAHKSEVSSESIEFNWETDFPIEKVEAHISPYKKSKAEKNGFGFNAEYYYLLIPDVELQVFFGEMLMMMDKPEETTKRSEEFLCPLEGVQS